MTSEIDANSKRHKTVQPPWPRKRDISKGKVILAVVAILLAAILSFLAQSLFLYLD